MDQVKLPLISLSIAGLLISYLLKIAHKVKEVYSYVVKLGKLCMQLGVVFLPARACWCDSTMDEG